MDAEKEVDTQPTMEYLRILVVFGHSTGKVLEPAGVLPRCYGAGFKVQGITDFKGV